MTRTTAETTTYRVCGIPIAALDPEAAARVIVDRSVSRGALEVHLCNAYTLSLVDLDHELRAALLRSHLNLPDGAPVARLGKRLGTRGPVRGPGLVADVARLGRDAGTRHYFFGAGPGIAKLMAERLSDAFPGMITAGCESPPFGPMDEASLRAVAQRIEASGANIVWVGLGTPRQDYLVPRLAAQLDMPVVPIGAAFDFWAGSVTEAPTWLHGSGLEWLHRLTSEPKRLWRRYLFGNPRFVLVHLRHVMRSR